MNEIKSTIIEQLQQLQMLMYRTSSHNYRSGRRMHDSHRGQGRVLAMLKIKPEISQRELTYLVGMRKQSIAELLAKLEKSGYITREPLEEDKRAMIIKLTEGGMAAADEADDNATETAKFLGCLNEDELAQFGEYLSRIIKHYEEQFPDKDFEERRKMQEEFMSHRRRGHRRGRGFRGHS